MQIKIKILKKSDYVQYPNILILNLFKYTIKIDLLIDPSFKRSYAVNGLIGNHKFVKRAKKICTQPKPLGFWYVCTRYVSRCLKKVKY